MFILCVVIPPNRRVMIIRWGNTQNLRFMQMFDVDTHRYSENVTWVNQFLPYDCEHVHIDQSKYSADLSF